MRRCEDITIFKCQCSSVKVRAEVSGRKTTNNTDLTCKNPKNCSHLCLQFLIEKVVGSVYRPVSGNHSAMSV